jgi:hypothetical protein
LIDQVTVDLVEKGIAKKWVKPSKLLEVVSKIRFVVLLFKPTDNCLLPGSSGLIAQNLNSPILGL